MKLNRREFVKTTAGVVTVASVGPTVDRPVAAAGAGGPDFNSVRADFPWIKRQVILRRHRPS